MSDLTDELDPAVELLVADLADEFCARQIRGERPDPNELAARHPVHAELIRDVLMALQAAPPPAPAAGVTIPDSQPGVLGDFRIIREIGRGGMGVVYEAEQLSLGRRVAVKVLQSAALADLRLLQRFENEARAAGVLDHPHIVKVYGVGQDRGAHFIVMQLIDGRPLSELIQTVHRPIASDESEPTVKLRLSVEPSTHHPTAPEDRQSTYPTVSTSTFFRRAAELGVQTAEALEHAHSIGVVHRDIKPGNLLLDAKGDLWVSDFGLAKLTASDSGVTLTGDVFGTLRYMSPEQALAKHDLVDHRTDVYSLGATLYELACGRPAVEGQDKAEILRRVAESDPIPLRRRNRSVPADLERIIDKCLRKEPNERYASARELADDLGRFLRGEPVRAKPIGPARRAARWVSRHPLPFSLAALTALAIVVAIAVAIRDAYRAEADRLALQAATDREKLRSAELRATQDVAERQRFFALLEQVRQRRADPYPGWSGKNLEVLRELAALPPASDYQHDLRTEAAAALSALDLVPAGTIGPDCPAGPIDYSPDGERLAAGRWGTLNVRVYDAATWRVDRELRLIPDANSIAYMVEYGMPDRVVAVRFSPDGKWLAAGTGSGRLVLWDTKTWGEPKSWAAHSNPARGGRPGTNVFGIAFASDGQSLITASRGSIRSWHLDGRPAGLAVDGYWLPGAIPPVAGQVTVCRAAENDHRLLDLEKGAILADTGHEGSFPLAVASGGRLLAMTLNQWSGVPALGGIDPGTKPRPLNTGPGAPLEMRNVEHLAFDPAGGLLVSVEEHIRRVKLWDTVAGRLAAENIVLGDAIRAVFSPDGRRIAIGGRHGVDLFDIPNRVSDVVGAGGPAPVIAMAASSDHKVLWSVDRLIEAPDKLYRQNIGSGELVPTVVCKMPPSWSAMPFAECTLNGRVAIYAHDSARSPVFLRTTAGTQWEVKAQCLQDTRVGPDGRLWTLESDRLKEGDITSSKNRTVWRNDLVAMSVGMVLRTMAVGGGSVFVGRRDGRLFRIDPATGTASAWPLLDTPVAGLALSPDESRLLAGGEGGEVLLVDPATGKAIAIPDAHRGAVPGVAFGRHFFVTGSADRRVRLWTPSGEPIATLRMQGPVRKVLLSEDESSLLVLVEGERAVRRWKLDALFREWAALGLTNPFPAR
jgi:serine/threonine protein kinase/WD40 repeat protein